MAEVEEITDGIRDLFCKYKEKQKVDLFRTFNNILCCDCGHKSRIQSAQCKLLWYNKMTKFYQIVLGFIAFLMLLVFYAFWAARRYNLALAFGNGACISTFVWTYDDCIVYF